jgi:hypothetical protein
MREIIQNTPQNQECGQKKVCFVKKKEQNASQLAVAHQLSMPNQGDLVADGRWLFEVGGKNKGFTQIKGIENNYVVADKIDIGHGSKIPLWLFGMLY